VLLLSRPIGGTLDGQLDPQRFELGAVRVEAPCERVLVHAAVALHVAPDLQCRDRPALGHQVGDQRQLADQLLGVLCHRTPKDRSLRREDSRARVSRSLFAKFQAASRACSADSMSTSPRAGKKAAPSIALSKLDRRLRGASSFSRRSKLPSPPPRLSIMCTSV